jgi:hypothetical protein
VSWFKVWLNKKRISATMCRTNKQGRAGRNINKFLNKDQPLGCRGVARYENGQKRTEKPLSRFRIRILPSETGSGQE